jgi:hypothetical protein
MIPDLGAVTGEDAATVIEPRELVIAASLYAVATMLLPAVETAIDTAAEVKATSEPTVLTVPLTDLSILKLYALTVQVWQLHA